MQMIVPKPVDTIANGPLCDQALLWYYATGGRLDRDPYGNLLDIVQRSHISIVEHSDRPPIFFHVGEHSSIAKIFGGNWATSSIGSMGLPDAPAERLCNPAYFTTVKEQVPQGHTCYAEFNNHSTFTESHYNRLLLPCTTLSGAPLVLCASDVRHWHTYN